MRTLIWLLAACELFVVGCAPNPPRTIWLDPALAHLRPLALDGIEHWCDAVGWCPTVVDRADDAEGEVWADFQYRGRARNSQGYNDGGDRHNPITDGPDVRINMWGDWRKNTPLMWLAIAHELGHFGIEDHTPSGIMAARHTAKEELRSCIDLAAVLAWCAEQGCPPDSRSTCD